MTCEHFWSLSDVKDYLNATRAERAAAQHHIITCPDCAKKINGVGGPPGNLGRKVLRRLATTFEIDCLDPEFVSVAFASRRYK